MSSNRRVFASLFCLVLVLGAMMGEANAKAVPPPASELSSVRVKRGKKINMILGALAGAFAGYSLHKMTHKHKGESERDSTATEPPAGSRSPSTDRASSGQASTKDEGQDEQSRR